MQSSLQVEKTVHLSLPDKKHPAQLLFALFVFVFAGYLLTQITEQTTFVNGKRLVDQPGFWPAISLGGMVLFGGLHALFIWRARVSRHSLKLELAHWSKALEFVLWFLVYVWVVPIVGYLPATLVFCPFLVLRLGYSSRAAIGWSLVAAVSIVLLFKTFLQVKIPGGAFYEYFPDGLRNFLIVYF